MADVEETPSVHCIAICRVPACKNNGKAFPVTVYLQPDGAQYPVMCALCQQIITDVVPIQDEPSESEPEDAEQRPSAGT